MSRDVNIAVENRAIVKSRSGVPKGAIVICGVSRKYQKAKWVRMLQEATDGTYCEEGKCIRGHTRSDVLAVRDDYRSRPLPLAFVNATLAREPGCLMDAIDTNGCWPYNNCLAAAPGADCDVTIVSPKQGNQAPPWRGNSPSS
jgi:hypothetical protein